MNLETVITRLSTHDTPYYTECVAFLREVQEAMREAAKRIDAIRDCPCGDEERHSHRCPDGERIDNLRRLAGSGDAK